MDKLYNEFFSPFQFRRVMPDIWAGFQINIRMMIAAEILVLVLALLLAVVRGLPGRAAWPLRAVAVVYTDFFRGTPLILVASLISIGVPLLNLHWPGTHHVEFFRIQPLLAIAGQLITIALFAAVWLARAINRGAGREAIAGLEERLRSPLIGLATAVGLAILAAVVLPAVGAPLTASANSGFDLGGAVIAVVVFVLLLVVLTVIRDAERLWRALIGRRAILIVAAAFALLAAIVGPSMGLSAHSLHIAGFGHGTLHIHIYGFTLYPLSKWPLTYYGIAALTITYTAYVAEVYRAGIQSVHPSQRMAARSLGLSYGQAMRYVILPQAIRRVIPPLLNDFIGLQKDTAIMAFIGLSEGLLAAQQYSSQYFNVTGYAVTAILFVLLTIPLARFTDHLIADREKKERAQLV